MQYHIFVAGAQFVVVDTYDEAIRVRGALRRAGNQDVSIEVRQAECRTLRRTPA